MARFISALLLASAVFASGCVRAQPPTDTGDPVASSPTTPTGPTAAPTTPTPPATSDTSALAYNPELKQLFGSDCVVCHGPTRADGNYRMSTYAQVMTAVRPGNTSSLLISVTQQNGRMYRYFSGSASTRQTKANQVRTWIVMYNAQENK
jgi:hypothetical protein